MRERQQFIHSLETYNDLAKSKHEAAHSAREVSGDADDDGLKDLEVAARVLERQYASARGQSPETQVDIFALQEEKARIMQKLQDDLEALDHPEVHAPQEKGAYDVKYEKKGGKERFFAKGMEVTKGMLLSDGEWGIRYHLDSSIPEELREQYLIGEARRQISRLYDQQTIEDKLGSDRTNDFKKTAYGAFKEMQGREEEVGGWVAERLVKSFFKRIAIDYDLDIELIETDVYQDVEYKIDFVIHRKERARGVDVEAREHAQDLGIQFTMHTDTKTLEHKQLQIDRVRSRKKSKLHVDDIVLVSLPLDGVRSMQAAWVEAGKPPGGPTAYLRLEERQAIFEQVLQGIVPPEAIKAQWEIVSKKAA